MTTHSPRPKRRARADRSAVSFATRFLIGSYFLTSSMGFFSNPLLSDMIGAMATSPVAAEFLSLAVTLAALLVILGHAVRPAALFLAVYLLWSAILHHAPTWTDAELSAFSREMAMLGGLILVAFQAPVVEFPRLAALRRRVVPRRIAVDNAPRLAAPIAADGDGPPPMRDASVGDNIFADI